MRSECPLRTLLTLGFIYFLGLSEQGARANFPNKQWVWYPGRTFAGEGAGTFSSEPQPNLFGSMA